MFRIRLLSMLVLLSVLGAAARGATFVPTGFSEAQVVTGLDPTTMAFTPDGRLFVCEKPGRLRLVTLSGGTYVLSTVVDLSANVTANNERGLMAVAVDPQWGDGSGNDYVYLYYTASTPTVHNRLSRFLVSSGTAVLANEQVLMDFDTLPGSVHMGGGLRFGQDGKLYVATGDGGSAGNSQNAGNLLGKLLRLDKDGSIPTDNPNYGTYTGNLRAIVALGLRNPYTLAVQSGTNRLFVNDVGGGAWEEVNSYTTGTNPAAVNYGWSTIEGVRTSQTPPANYVDPVHVYDHGVGTAICGSAFYHPSSPTGIAFPSVWTGCYFFCDYGDYAANTGEIYWIDPAAPATRTLFANGVNRPIAVEVAPDGALWYVARGPIVNGGAGSEADNGSVGTAGSLYRVTYVGGGTPTKVTFVQQPSDTNASTTITPAVTVALRDASDNIVNSTATVTVALGANPGGGTLAGTLSLAAVDGVATFANLSIDAPAAGYTLTAASTGLTGATSSSFTILANVATPVIAPGTGTFTGPVWVQLTSATPGAQIRYTTDGSAPTAGSTLYSAPFQRTATTTVRAIALKSGLTTSSEASATITITGSTPYGWPSRPPVSGVAMPATVAGALPATLGATNLFTSLTTLTAAPGMIPYDMNSPLWSDGAHKRRWVGLPGTSRIGFAATGEYVWPGGTIFVKHFELTTNEVSDTRRRLETRVLVLDGAGTNGYGVTYRWNDAGTEATLVAADGLDETVTVTTASGSRPQTWRYPSRSQCLQCHTQNAGFVLGPKTRQLNGTYTYPGTGAGIGSDNQLRTWNYLRMFTTDIGEGSIAGLSKLVRIDDGSATLEQRVRSYLDANCANCH
jgi:glucose/arabinose dehydrogenase